MEIQKKSLGLNTTRGLKKYSQNQLRSLILDGDKPKF